MLTVIGCLPALSVLPGAAGKVGFGAGVSGIAPFPWVFGSVGGMEPWAFTYVLREKQESGWETIEFPQNLLTKIPGPHRLRLIYSFGLFGAPFLSTPQRTPLLEKQLCPGGIINKITKTQDNMLQFVVVSRTPGVERAWNYVVECNK